MAVEQRMPFGWIFVHAADRGLRAGDSRRATGLVTGTQNDATDALVGTFARLTERINAIAEEITLTFACGLA